MMMDGTSSSALSERYLTALQTYVLSDSPLSLQEAHELGEQAVAQGLETFDLAGIHRQALKEVGLQNISVVTQEDRSMRAALFFTEVLIPMVEIRRDGTTSGEEWQQLNTILDRRTLTLSDTQRKLRQEITGRQQAEADSKRREEHSSQLLAESRLMEENLQAIIRRILSANEAGRKMMSQQLHDEIAQTLLGIHVRLLKLRKEVGLNKVVVSLEIAGIQDLVEESVKIVNRLAHEFSKSNEAQAQ